MVNRGVVGDALLLVIQLFDGVIVRSGLIERNCFKLNASFCRILSTFHFLAVRILQHEGELSTLQFCVVQTLCNTQAYRCRLCLILVGEGNVLRSRLVAGDFLVDAVGRFQLAVSVVHNQCVYGVAVAVIDHAALAVVHLTDSVGVASRLRVGHLIEGHLAVCVICRFRDHLAVLHQTELEFAVLQISSIQFLGDVNLIRYAGGQFLYSIGVGKSKQVIGLRIPAYRQVSFSVILQGEFEFLSALGIVHNARYASGLRHAVLEGLFTGTVICRIHVFQIVNSEFQRSKGYVAVSVVANRCILQHRSGFGQCLQREGELAADIRRIQSFLRFQSLASGYVHRNGFAGSVGVHKFTLISGILRIDGLRGEGSVVVVGNLYREIEASRSHGNSLWQVVCRFCHTVVHGVYHLAILGGLGSVSIFYRLLQYGAVSGRLFIGPVAQRIEMDAAVRAVRLGLKYGAFATVTRLRHQLKGELAGFQLSAGQLLGSVDIRLGSAGNIRGSVVPVRKCQGNALFAHCRVLVAYGLPEQFLAGLVLQYHFRLQRSVAAVLCGDFQFVLTLIVDDALCRALHLFKGVTIGLSDIRLFQGHVQSAQYGNGLALCTGFARYGCTVFRNVQLLRRRFVCAFQGKTKIIFRHVPAGQNFGHAQSQNLIHRQIFCRVFICKCLASADSGYRCGELARSVIGNGDGNVANRLVVGHARCFRTRYLLFQLILILARLLEGQRAEFNRCFAVLHICLADGNFVILRHRCGFHAVRFRYVLQLKGKGFAVLPLSSGELLVETGDNLYRIRRCRRVGVGEPNGRSAGILVGAVVCFYRFAGTVCVLHGYLGDHVHGSVAIVLWGDFHGTDSFVVGHTLDASLGFPNDVGLGLSGHGLVEGKIRQNIHGVRFAGSALVRVGDFRRLAVLRSVGEFKLARLHGTAVQHLLNVQGTGGSEYQAGFIVVLEYGFVRLIRYGTVVVFHLGFELARVIRIVGYGHGHLGGVAVIGHSAGRCPRYLLGNVKVIYAFFSEGDIAESKVLCLAVLQILYRSGISVLGDGNIVLLNRLLRLCIRCQFEVKCFVGLSVSSGEGLLARKCRVSGKGYGICFVGVPENRHGLQFSSVCIQILVIRNYRVLTVHVIDVHVDAYFVFRIVIGQSVYGVVVGCGRTFRQDFLHLVLVSERFILRCTLCVLCRKGDASEFYAISDVGCVHVSGSAVRQRCTFGNRCESELIVAVL